MRPLRLCLIALAATSSTLALAPISAQMMKAQPKMGATSGPETRYFTSIDGLMDGNADVILRETRQGKTVTAASLDVCYPADKATDRKDRFVADLTVSGQTLTGSGQTQIDKLPVSVKLTRKPTGDTFEFKGQIVVGPATTTVNSSENADQSEREFQENQSADDNIVATPKDFTEVSPEAVAIKIKLDAALDFIKSLRGQNVELSLASLAVGCDALRAGEQVITLSIDPQRAAAFIGKTKNAPGVVNVGWTSGSFEMERSIRFPAADWRDGDKINRDKIATTVGNVMGKALSAKLATTTWSDDTGKLKMIFKRPSQVLPALDLTETVEITALVAADKPSGSDRLMLWVSTPTVTTADETTGPKLSVADTASADEESDPRDDNNAVGALATEFKAQRWDPDKSEWK